MTVDFFDGFDKYGAPNVNGFNPFGPPGPINFWNVAAGEWTLFGTPTGQANISAPLSRFGQSLTVTGGNNGNGGPGRTFTASGRVLGTAWVMFNGAGFWNGNLGFCYRKGATNCFAMGFDTSGHWTLYQQDMGGTLIAAQSTAQAQNTPHYVAWDITIGASVNYQVWFDGLSIFSGSTGNTGNGQTTVDTFIIGKNAGSAGNNTTNAFTVDNLAQFNTGGATNNSVLINGPQIDTTYPTADSQSQYSFGQGVLGPAYVLTGNQTASFYGNGMGLRKFTPAFNCTLNAIAFYNQAGNVATNNVKGCVYSDNAGTPNTLLSDGIALTQIAANTLVTLPLVTPVSLTAGTPYWIGGYSDGANWLMPVTDPSATLVQKNVTYSSGAPASFGSPNATGQPNGYIVGLVTGIANHFSAVNQNPQPIPTGYDLSYLSSSTVGNEDLFTMGAILQTPSVIYAAKALQACRNADGGARTVDCRMKSAAVDSAGSNPGQTPNTTYGWLTSYFETDPNTAAAWTQTNLNAALTGMKIAS